MNMFAETEYLERTTRFSAELAVDINNLTRRFGANTVLDNLSMAIRPGEFVALLGRSGSGKSTLLRTLCGLDEVPAGKVKVPAARTIVFQEPRLLPWKRVWRNVILGLRVADARNRAETALAEVGLGHRLNAWPLTLSGGEAQVREPELLLLDEPFAALDALTRLKMQSMVTALWQTHLPAILLVTHDVDEALALADRALILDQGRIALDIEIDLPRPRRHDSGAFGKYRTTLLMALGVDEAH
jgi:sulfonate transport system ATP-binding protein